MILDQAQVACLRSKKARRVKVSKIGVTVHQEDTDEFVTTQVTTITQPDDCRPSTSSVSSVQERTSLADTHIFVNFKGQNGHI